MRSRPYDPVFRNQALGASGYESEDIRENIRWIKDHTDKPFGVDLQFPAKLEDVEENKTEVKATLPLEYPEHVAWVNRMKEKFGVPDAASEEDYAYTASFIRRQEEITLEEQAPLVPAER